MQAKIDVQNQTKQINLSRGQIVGTLVALQLALLLAALDQTVVSTAMPHIVSQLNGFNRYAWVTTAYLLTSTCAVPIFSRLSDIYGRKIIFVGSLILFTIASFACGSASAINPIFDGMNNLILSRSLQGIAGGAILGLCFTIVGDIFSPADRGKYQGVFAAVFAAAALVGPTAGGWVSDVFSWRWLFFVNVPIGLLAAAIFAWSFPKVQLQSIKKTVDYLGLFSLVAFLVPLLLALTWAVDSGWRSVIWMLVLSVAMFIAFIAAEARSDFPLVPLSLFADRTVSISCLSVFVSGIGMFGSILLIPLFLQSTLNVSAATSGILMAPLMVVAAIASIVSGQLISRWRYKPVILSGWFCMAVGVLLLSTISIHTSLTTMMSYMIVCGIGMGALLPIYTVIIQSAAPQNLLGIATSLSQFFRSVGGTVGTAVFGSIMVYLYRLNLHIDLEIKSNGAVYDAIHKIIYNALDPIKLKTQLLQVVPLRMDINIDALVLNVKHALIGSIDGVFLIYGVILIATFILNCFLSEIPLRKSGSI